MLGAHAGSAGNAPDMKWPENAGPGTCPPPYTGLKNCWNTSPEFYFRRVEDLLIRPEVIAEQLARVESDDPTAGDLAAVDRALAEVDRQQANVARLAALADDDDAGAPLLAQLRTLGERKRQLAEERAGIERRRGAWLAARDQLANVTEWCRRVSANLPTLDYAEKRLALEWLGVRVRLWGTDHSPRYEITASIPLAAPIVDSTTRSSTATRTATAGSTSTCWARTPAAPGTPRT